MAAEDRARLQDRLIAAEQDERRRIALFLHDGPVQSLSGIALMLDAVVHSIEAGRTEEATQVLQSALERQRATVRELRDLSFALEPVVLRDQGFGPAVSALTEQLGLAHELKIELDVDAGDRLGEKAQIALYTIIRESLELALRRGPRSQIQVRIAELFRDAVRAHAAAIIVVHNHPSGDPEPSADDLHLTAEAIAAGRLLDIPLLDHVILAGDSYVSLRDRGIAFDDPRRR